jgi:hypothetical protein
MKPLYRRRGKLERARGDDRLRPLDLSEHGTDVHAPMRRHERREAPCRLLELPLAADAVAAACLVPGNRDMDESLEEVAFSGLCRPPLELELLVRGEELAAADQIEAAEEVRPRFDQWTRH